MNVSVVKAYACPLCRKIHKSESDSEKCFSSCKRHAAKKEVEKKRKASWAKKMDEVRLNAETFEQVLKMIQRAAKQHFGCTVKYSELHAHFGSVSLSHNAPIGMETNWGGKDKKKPTDALGWSGQVKGTITQKGRNYEGETIDSFSDLFTNNGIRGFHTGTGGGGSKEWHYSFSFFLDDFPKMKDNFETMEKLTQQAMIYEKELEKQTSKVNSELDKLMDQNPSVVSLREKAEQLIKDRERITKEINETYLRINGEREATHSSVNKKRLTSYKIDKKYTYDGDKLNELVESFENKYGL